jgi:hypothetical protein
MYRIGIRLQSFPFSALCAALLPVSAALVDRLRPASALRPMESWPLCLVVTIFAWAMLMLVGRSLYVLRVARVYRLTPELQTEQFLMYGTLAPPLAHYLGLPDWQLHDESDADDRVLRTEAAFADLDNSAQAWMTPVHALIWALPGVGFLGTAWELRKAIGALFKNGRAADPEWASLGESMGVSLGAAFGVICLALATTAVAHVVSAIVSKREAQLAIGLRQWWFLTRWAVRQQAGISGG